MLSVENPPPDPSCSCQFQPLNSTNSDETPSHNLSLPEVDLHLLNPPHDHHPKFSIRDYVFTSRSKDIKKNWPFSLKNLQLCLRHGVKDVLPPFQAVSEVKTQTQSNTKICTVETETERKSVSNFDDAEPSGPNNNEQQLLNSSDNVELNHKVENACIDTSSCRSGGENDFPSTTTSVSHSEIESVPTERPSSSPLETDTLLEASASVSASATVEVEGAAHPTSHKTENTTRPPGKKCRLIVKFSGNSDRSSTEDIASNSTAVSETMASKVCPVCKTFTSSSNTTLNAHIDQCLSAESTPKWTADSKLTRHRIKPRKTRLMVDIYTTAQRCTLEELDRRNGTSWATISKLPAQDAEKLDQIPADGKRQRVSQAHPEDAGEVGEVYIDANGTKLRILSKPNDAPTVSKVVEDVQPKNPLKAAGKGSKFLSAKKKKRHARKHLKYLKLSPQSRKFFSQKARASQLHGGQEGDYGMEDNGKEKHQIEKQIKSSDSGTLRQWVCSKRSSPAKRVNNQDGHQPFRCKWHLARDLLVESDQSSLGESLTERNRVQKYTNLSENLLSSPAINERTEKPLFKDQISEKWEHSSGRKRVGSPLLGARISDNMEGSLPSPMKQNGNQLSKESPFMHGSHTVEPPNSNKSCAPSLTNKRVSIPGGPVSNSDIPSWKMPSMSCQVFVPKALRMLSRKNASSFSSRSSMTKSKPNMDKCPARKKTHVDLIGEVDEEVATWHSDVDQQYALMCSGTDENLEREVMTDKMSFGRGTVQKTRQDRTGVSVSQEDEAMALESSQPHCYARDEGDNTDSSGRASDHDLLDKVDALESVEGTVTSLSKPVDTKFYKLSGRSKSQSNSLHSLDYNGMLCGGEVLIGTSEPSFVDGQQMYCPDNVGNDMIGQNTHIEPRLDSDIGQGNSFPEVDPIPIPGPPGSFLPSPRDMGSDDFQGNSSLTTSRVQSSQDQLDLVDGDLSDSPISATSTISNSNAARSDLKFSESLSSVGPHAVQDKMMSGFSSVSFEPSLENAAAVPHTGTGAEKTYFDGEKFKVNKISIEKRPLSFKNDGQPCCCQRKERISQDIAPNYQESQLLRRRSMASMTVPAMGKQNSRSNNFEMRSEMFSFSSCASVGSEKVLPILKSPTGSIPLKGSPEGGMKFLGHGDCETPSPSTPNPVLRLMGKNLMVVNKEEDTSVPLGQSQPCVQNSHVMSQFPTSSRVSPGNMQNQDCHSFPHMVPQGPLIFSRNPYDSVGQPFDVRLSNSFRNYSNLRTPQSPAQAPAGLFPKQHINGSFAAALESHMYEDAYSLSRHNRPKIRLSETSSYNTDKVITTLDHPHKTADDGASMREIIVIDDVAETDAKETCEVVKYSEGSRAVQLISSGVSIPTVPSYNSRHVNPLSCYQAQDPSLLAESPVAHNSNFHANPSRLPSSSPVRWGCTPENSGGLQRNSFMAASTSTGHLASGLYYSPSLS